MKAYRMFNPRIKKVIFNHDVIFNKTCIELCIQQGVSSLEQNITIEEINFDVFSFKYNTTSKELGDLRWPYEIGVFPNVSPTSTRDEYQGSNLFGT
jgi:hypothetical protein